MAKAQVQKAVEIWRVSGSFAANGEISGCAVCDGYSRLRGIFRTDAALSSGSGLRIEHSLDLGANWDYISASDTVAACGSTACDVVLVGNAVRITASNAGTEASALRAAFYLLPVN